MATDATAKRSGWRAAVVRDPHEPHRASTPLELLFDLAIVVAVAQAAHSLETLLVEHHYADALIGYAMAFTALWWAWMNFTWFATAHDADDIPYRLLTFVQIAGALVMAAGVQAAMEERDFGMITAGYVIMRVAIVAQWLRVRASVPAHRQRATLYALGVLTIQVLWIARLALPDSWQVPIWIVLMAGELLVPVVAERVTGRTVYHLGHIAERYSLFTIIVLGESLFASAISIRDAVDVVGVTADAIAISVGLLVIAFGAWWVYFNRQGHHEPPRTQTVFMWGYGHLVVFASLAALGAGGQLAAAWLDHDHASERLASLGVAIPAAVYLLAIAAIDRIVHGLRGPLRFKVIEAAVIVLIGLVAPVPVTVLGTAAVYAAAVVMLELHNRGRLDLNT